TFKSFHKWLGTAAIQPANKTGWMRLFGRKPTTSAYDKAKCQALAGKITNYIDDLERQLHNADDAEIEQKDTLARKAETDSEVSLELKVAPITVGMKDKNRDSFSAESQIQEKFGSSRFRVGNFHSFGSMQVRIFSRRYSSSRKP